MNSYRQLYFLFFCSLYAHLEGKIFTLDFSVTQYAFAPYSGILYTGATHPSNGNEYAVTAMGRIGSSSVPLAPATVTLNNRADQSNPLNGAGISFLASWGDRPLVVKSTEPDTLFFYATIGFSQTPIQLSLISLAGITDANGQSGTIIALATDSERSFAYNAATKTNTKISPTNAFVAVQTPGGIIGDTGTGLALVTYTEATDNSALSVAPTVPFNGSLSALFITNPATLTAINDMYWDPVLQKLFIAIGATSGSEASDGVRSVVVGTIENGNLVFTPLAPDSAFDSSSNQLIGITGAGSQSSVDQVGVMHTSTRLSYLILKKENGIYAAPLINGLQDPNKATLASVTSVPTNTFGTRFPYPFLYRTLNEPATTPAQMATRSSLGAQVGGSYVFPDTTTLETFSISTDTVFVEVHDSATATLGGVFYSQALFGANGTIQAWTDWQRIGGTVGNFTGSAYDPFSVLFWSIDSALNSTRIVRSEWTEYSLQESFPQSNGGVQTVAPFSIGGNSLIAVGGNGTCTLTQTGDSSGPTTPTTFTYSVPSVGAITTIVVASSGDCYWIVIGGSGGVALLTDDSGNGWNGTVSDLATLSPRILGNYTNVRTLATQDSSLYILTDTLLDRIALASSKLATTHLATLDTVPGTPKTFSDLYVAQPTILLATTRGLFMSNTTDIVWIPVTLNESPGPVSALYGVGTDDWKNIYAIASSATADQSNMYRLALNSSHTLTAFQDYFIKDLPTFFMAIGDFRNFMTNNGALFAFSRSKYLQQPVIFEKLPPDFRFGEYQLALRATPITSLPLTAETIRRLSYDPATGSLLAYGNFGITINQ